MRSARGAAARSIGQPLNLTSYTSHTCPPGYHWVDTPAGPIMGLKRARTHTMARLAACVPNPAPPPAAPPPPHKVIALRTGPAAPAAPPPAAVATTPAPRFQTFAAPASSFTPATFTQPAAPAAVEPTPSAPAAPACDCWPLWWLLVPLAAGAAAGYMLTGKDGKKRRKNAARYVVRHVVQRIPNPIAALGF